ncbi:hypothetical protein J1N35_039641 [Gossypium stocksii]|uniref:RNase H type-1 domain-containing protein n=1 Tax=Gossypium stocksii TaxID=47602 RepID=A0A9D3UCM5_9ROSI|nr:hypothetical protein J1N35_039641 [Gossypium stocksii]
MRIGKERIVKVETRTILEGLQIVWEAGYRHWDLKCDNVMVVKSILVGEIVVNRMTKLRMVDQLLKRNWSVQVRHIPKDHKKVIDHIAKLACYNLNSL